MKLRNTFLIILIISAILVAEGAIASTNEPQLFGISIDQSSLDILTLTAERFNDISDSNEIDQAISMKAKLIISTLVNSDDVPVKLPDMVLQARMEIIKGQPDFVRVNIITDFGKLQFVSAGANSLSVLPDDGVFAKGNFPEMIPQNLILPDDDDGGLFTMLNIFGGIPFGSFFSNAPVGGSGTDIQFVENINPEDMKVVIRYRGLDKTESGIAHVITVGSLPYKQYMKLWILKDTFDLYQISIEDERGTEIFLVITEMDSDITPPTTFNIDTAGMTQVKTDDLIGIFLTKMASSPIMSSPMVADFSLSDDPIARTGIVLANSDGFDLQDREDQLLCEMQYKSPSGLWTPIKTEYAGLAPVGHWSSELAIPIDAELGKYSFRVRYIDRSGNVSNWSEYPDIMTVTPEPPRIVKITPNNNESGIPVYSKIFVTFSKPMNKASVEKSFAMASRGIAIKGSFEWDKNMMIFTPNTDLAYNTRYLLRISGLAMDTSNIGLDGNFDARSDGEYIDDYIWEFTTGESVPMLVFNPTYQIIYKGDIFDVKITAKNVSAMSKFSFKVNFDPQTFEVISFTKESFLSWRPSPESFEGVDLWKNVETDNLSGVVTFACNGTRKDGVSGSGYLATLTFKCKSDGKFAIKFSNVSISDKNGSNIPVVIRDAEIQSLEFNPLDVNHDGVVDINDIVASKENVQLSPFSGKFALGQNYPNPFNPETWIPYQLARSADVTVKIYKATGEIVRILNIGYQQAGNYIDRTNSAYWDGRDDSGQKVSGGVYFYTIKADNFSATRKMLVQK